MQQAHALLVASELNALRSKLNPHFLFNTLHSIIALTRKNPNAAETALFQFSDMLRYVLDTEKTGSDHVTLNDELMKRVRSMDDSNAWVVGRFDALSGRAHLPEMESGFAARRRTAWEAPFGWRPVLPGPARGLSAGVVRGLLRGEASPAAWLNAVPYLLCYRAATSQCVFPGGSVRRKKEKLPRGEGGSRN